MEQPPEYLNSPDHYLLIHIFPCNNMKRVHLIGNICSPCLGYLQDASANVTYVEWAMILNFTFGAYCQGT